jgi:hypothetical protein
MRKSSVNAKGRDSKRMRRYAAQGIRSRKEREIPQIAGFFNAELTWTEIQMCDSWMTGEERDDVCDLDVR